MWTFLVGGLVLAAPVQIEVMGFSVTRDQAVVTVTTVTPGSPAAAMGLEPGMTLVQLMSPTWMFMGGRGLSELDERDLHDALSPPAGEALVLRVRRGDSSAILSGACKAAAPDPWTVGPLTTDGLQRLSVMQLGRYNAWQVAGRRLTPEPRAPLALEGRPVARLAKETLLAVDSGGWTPAWVYLSGRLRFSCASSPMRFVELTSEAPVPRVAAQSSDQALQGSSVPVELPLWRTRDVVAACKAGKQRVASVPLTATLGCDGQAPSSLPLTLDLELACDEPAPKEVFRLQLRVERETLVMGEGATQKAWWWSRDPPRPRAVAVVERDAQGRVTRRLGALTPGDDSEWSARISFDVARPRAFSAALELEFPDGTTEVGPPLAMRVISHEDDAKELALFRAQLDASEAVRRRLFLQRPDFCKDPQGTVAWLQQQPEVTFAASADHGHSISFQALKGPPHLLSCHEH